MLLHILLCYTVISYIVGAVLWVAEVIIIAQNKRLAKEMRKNTSENIMYICKYTNPTPFSFMAILWIMSPLTAWHGVLHYMSLGWSKLLGKPFQPWI